MTLYNPTVDLVNDNVYTKFSKNLFIHSQDMEQNQILTPIKVCNSVANLRKMTLYTPNVDLVNDNVYPKFGLNPSIRSQDIEQKSNYDGMTDRANPV